MDQQKFVELLQDIQIPDTDRVKAATNELRKSYYPHPESLLWLLQFLTSHESSKIRQQAAVEASRLIPKHWVALPEAQKPAIRNSLLLSTVGEQEKLVRHSAARVISAVAKIDLEDGEWADLPQLLLQAAESKEVHHREVGIYILYTLLQAVGDGFTDKLPNLFSLFNRTIRDPESSEVRLNTMLALSTVATLIDPDESPQSLEAFRQILPSMVTVLKNGIDEGDEHAAMQAFEVFQTLLGCESALLASHFRDLVQFMLDLAVDTGHSEETRSQALSFLMQCVKYRRMKIQGLKDMGVQLTTKSMQIVTEISDDDEDELTPARSALGLLDSLAGSLPPRQVIVPVLKILPQYANSENPSYRKAGILALGMCVEGAPDFIGSQLPEIIPIVMKLLHDSDVKVRQAALHGVGRLADELAEDMSKEHALLIPVLLKNLDSAMAPAGDEAEQKINIGMMIGACAALDSLVDGMDSEIMASYAPELVPRLGRLFTHPDYKVKASAAGAMGSVAGAAGSQFLPYFEPTMKVLSEYVTIKDSPEELDLRGTVCDAMGSMATAVGGDAFKPYVLPLMQASEEALHLDHPRLRETSYILWSTLAKVYGEDFTRFLGGVVKGLLESLEQEESDMEVELGEEAAAIEVIVAGKKVKVTTAADKTEDMDPMDDSGNDSDDDWADLTSVTAVALEKEIAVEVIGDVLSHTRQNFLPYVEKTIEAVNRLVDHSYEGVRKSAISTLWRSYACLWALMEDHTGKKWQPGIPLKEQPTQELVKLGEVIVPATLGLWEDEIDRTVVTDINRNVAETLKLCGPAILTQSNMLDITTRILASIVNRQHLCQMDLGDDDDQDEVEESSEYDWLVVDTALDVVIALSVALGPQFGDIWRRYEKPVMKFASSQEHYERSAAVGVIAECIVGMGPAVTPYTEKLLAILLHRLSDEDAEAKSNAAYAVGLLVTHSTNTAAYLPMYNEILSKLEPLFGTKRARTLDNAAGCVSRMIIAHPDKVPIEEVLPVLVDLLPLKEDYEENKPIYDCIVGLYQHGDATILSLTPKLVGVFAEVLGSSDEQLEDETREKVVDTVKYLAMQQPGLVQGNEILMSVVRG